MANLGFESAKVGIQDATGKVLKVLSFDAKKGGAIDAKITGLAAEAVKVNASNIPFYVSQKGTGDIKLDLTLFDVTDEEMADLTGAKYEDGVLSIGKDTAAPYVTVLLQTAGIKDDDIYIALTKGKLAYDGDELKTNEEKGNEPGSVALSGEFIADGSTGYSYLKTRSTNEGFTEEDWLKRVFPGYTAPAGKTSQPTTDGKK